MIYNILWFYVDHWQVYLHYSLQLCFYVLYHQELSCCYYHYYYYYYYFDESHHRGLSCYYVNGFCRLVSWKAKLIVLLMDTAVRDSYRSFKTSSNRFSKLLKVCVNPSHENLGKIMPDSENLKAYKTWLPKLLTIVSNLFGPGTQGY